MIPIWPCANPRTKCVDGRFSPDEWDPYGRRDLARDRSLRRGYGFSEAGRPKTIYIIASYGRRHRVNRTKTWRNVGEKNNRVARVFFRLASFRWRAQNKKITNHCVLSTRPVKVFCRKSPRTRKKHFKLAGRPARDYAGHVSVGACAVYMLYPRINGPVHAQRKRVSCIIYYYMARWE